MKESDIQIADIEKELARLGKLEKSSNPIQACLFNLLVYVHDKRRISYLQGLTQSIVERFPCRIIFIYEDPEATANFLNVNVSHELIGKGSSGIACEQIVINVSEDQRKRIPFIVLPNLVPDLPIYFLCGQDPSIENRILPYLEKYISRLIFDTECAKDLYSYSRKVLQMMEDHPKMSFVDINWVKLSGWRQACRQIFDCSSHSHSLLKPKNLIIKFNDKVGESIRHHHLQALYLTGWLSSRLQWVFLKGEKSEELKLSFSRDASRFNVTIIPVESESFTAGDIVGIELTDDKNCHYALDVMEKQSKLIVHITKEETCDLPFMLSMPGLRKPFPSVRELFFAPLSPHYSEMLQAVASMQI